MEVSSRVSDVSVASLSLYLMKRMAASFLPIVGEAGRDLFHSPVLERSPASGAAA